MCHVSVKFKHHRELLIEVESAVFFPSDNEKTCEISMTVMFYFIHHMLIPPAVFVIQ